MESKATLIYNLTPEDLIEKISEIIKNEITELKKEYQPKEPEELLTRKEIAAMLKVNLSTIHNHTKNGKLKAYGLGNREYYKRSEIEKKLIHFNQLGSIRKYER